MGKYKQIDTIQLMYGIFQCCRGGYSGTPAALNVLDETLDFIKQQGQFVIEVPETWVKQNDLNAHVIGWWAVPKRQYNLSTANQELFALICLGTPELRRLWEAGSFEAVQLLGYAFHNVPRLLRTPDKFQPKSFLRNMRLHWDEYSLELRQAVCDMAGVKVKDALTLLSEKPL